MKKFLLKVLLFALYVFTFQFVLPVTVDPFGVFHADNIMRTNSNINGNNNYIKMTYILKHPDKFTGFLFGSSRVGAIHTDKMPGGKIYNMTYPNGLLHEHLENIKTFFSNGIFPKVIYIGLDELSYIVPPESHFSDPLRCPYEILQDRYYFYQLYLRPMDAVRSILIRPSLKSSEREKSLENSYEYGSWVKYGMRRKGPIQPMPMNFMEYSTDDLICTVNDMKEILNLCRINRTKVVVFTNPTYFITYGRSIGKRYIDFLEKLSDVTDFWNFSGFNDITLSNDNYIDASHYRAEVGDIMIDVMCNGKSYPKLQAQGFGVKVTKENAKDFITMLRKQAENFTE